MKAFAPARMETARYLARETLVSAAINAAISVGFFLLVFRGRDPIPVWGMGSYAFDFVPQSLAIGLMAVLVPGLMCRKAMIDGRVTGSSSAPPMPQVVVRALLNAILAVILGAGACALVLWATGADALPNASAFVLKILYGAALGAVVTRIALRRMLG